MQISRFEKKYIINILERTLVEAHVANAIWPDEHNKSDGYLVRSLYFDSMDDTDYWAKINGEKSRKKIRIRTYDPTSSHANLEIKRKDGEHQIKSSIKIKKEDVYELIKGNYSVLNTYDNKTAKDAYAIMAAYGYQPKAVVDYKRKAFVYPINNTRITFDSQITATSSDFNIFNPKLNTAPVLDPSQIILEVKYNHFIFTYIKNALSVIDKSPVSASKYILAREGVCQTL